MDILVLGDHYIADRNDTAVGKAMSAFASS
jgi:hypothetical protein